MNLAFTPGQLAWQDEIQAFLREALPPDRLSAIHQREATASYAPVDQAFSRQLGERGWLSLAWPRELGGGGRPLMDQAILNDQLGRVRAPIGFHNVATEWVAHPLIVFGTEEQKARLLPEIAGGVVSYAPCFTEPEAGSDLAAIKTSAVRNGEAYVVDGLKVFISSAELADYFWLLAVTDAAGPRHHNLSMFIVDAHSPGIRLRGVPTMEHSTIYDVTFEEVRVPAENLVGGENAGWKVAVSTLNAERSGIYYVSANQAWLADLAAFARANERYGRAIADDPHVRRLFAHWEIELEAQRMLSWRIAWLQNQGQLSGIEASIQNLRQRSFEHQLANFGMQILGLYGGLAPGTEWAPLFGRIEKMYLTSSSQHAGGSTEIQRNIIAMHGLGLPTE